MALDLLLNDENDIQIANGDFVIGESLTQEVALILKSSQGEWKNDPLTGANLIQLINSNVDETSLRKRVKLHLHRDNKDYNEIKEFINLRRQVQ